jgi:hypothetical protein
VLKGGSAKGCGTLKGGGGGAKGAGMLKGWGVQKEYQNNHLLPPTTTKKCLEVDMSPMLWDMQAASPGGHLE